MSSTPVTPLEFIDVPEALHLPLTCGPPLPADTVKPKVWIVFGATGLMGRALVNAALEHGDKVAAVGRMAETSPEAMQGWHKNCFGDLCDVRIRKTVDAVLKRAIAHFGEVDIIANCTCYGVIGSCEDQSMADVRAQFETNYFGTLHIIQLSLPYFRQRHAARQTQTTSKSVSRPGGGRYLIFSSTSGALGVPGIGPFGAAKYAIEGLVESMLYEVDAHGIKATLVSPGPLRNDLVDDCDANGHDGWPYRVNGKTPPQPQPPRRSTAAAVVAASSAATNPTRSSPDRDRDTTRPAPQHRKVIPPMESTYGTFVARRPTAPYAHHSSPSQHVQRIGTWMMDKQPVSAVKSAELAWQLGHCRFPPLRLLLGTFAVESIRDRSKSITEEIEDWKHLNFGPHGRDEPGGQGPDPDFVVDGERVEARDEHMLDSDNEHGNVSDQQYHDHDDFNDDGGESNHDSD